MRYQSLRLGSGTTVGGCGGVQYRQIYALLAANLWSVLSVASLVAFSSAKKKSHDVAIWQMPIEGCNALFYVEQDPNPFLKNAQQVKVGDAVQFRVGDTTLERFPDEISLRVYYYPNSPSSFTTITGKVCKTFDAGAIKFRAVWSNKSRNLTADGQLLDVERHDPEPFCEDKCSFWWTYDLRIAAKDVPLTDHLIVTMDAADGTRVAKLFGGLGPLDYQINPAPLP
jgi:hypothetical protein